MRRALVFAMVGLLFGSALPASADAKAPGGTFLDDDALEAEPAIEALFANHITSGCGPEIFCPNKTVTRAETAAFMIRALGLTPSESAPAFPDLPASAWYTGYVTRMHQLGLVAGYPDGTFRPIAAVTRAEMATLLVRALKLELSDPKSGFDSPVFNDVKQSDWFSPFVETLRANGLTAGCGNGRFCPNDPVLRQHMALFIARAFNLTPLAPPARYGPLNGLRVLDGFSVRRRVIAVKIDNASQARPQSGLERADAVMELPVEGGRTRIIALFHQTDATYVGPVRSARPTDEMLFSLNATAAVSGAQPWIADQVAANGLSLIRHPQVLDPILFRIRTRAAPYNLYTNTIELRAEADRRGYTNSGPPDLFKFGGFAYDQAQLASTITLSWSDPVQVTWRWDGTKYVRSMGNEVHSWIDQAGNTGQVAAANLIVIFGREYEVRPPAGIAGTPVPAIQTVGSGRMVFFSSGRMVEGTWSRPDNATWFKFEVAGSELIVPAGVPWISIFPDHRQVTWS